MGDLTTTTEQSTRLASRYRQVRGLTEALAAPLSPEDQTVQSMPDVSPTKWHRAHTSWFFETFLLQPELRGYRPFHPAYAYLFNSYYEGVGARYPRPRRGVVSRPGVAEVGEYRRHVDEAMTRLLAGTLTPGVADLVELGLHHEQQHQELLLMDIKHVLSCNPLQPAYTTVTFDEPRAARPAAWVEHEGGLVEIGHRGQEFAFDNEFPRHTAHLEPFAIADRPVTCGEWLAFMDDDGYGRPTCGSPTGGPPLRPRSGAPRSTGSRSWTTGGCSPWEGPSSSTPPNPWATSVTTKPTPSHGGRRGACPPRPSGKRWQPTGCRTGNFLDLTVLHPRPTAQSASFFGDVWQWTSSSYSPYPGFRPAPGAVGEYNGKFMVNQYVLRGGSCVTSPDHVRATYRNFFPPQPAGPSPVCAWHATPEQACPLRRHRWTSI